MQSHVILLRTEHGERQRLFGIAMITRRVQPVRNAVRDHAVTDSLLVVRIEVLQNDFANRVDS